MTLIIDIFLMVTSAFALFWIFKSRKLIPSIISIGMVISTILVLFTTKPLQPYGLHAYMAFVALAFIYGVTVKNKKIGSRIIICLMSASIFVYWLWTFNHWHGNTALLPIVTLLTAIAAYIYRKKLKNEIGFLSILAADAIVIIIENWLNT